MGTDYVEKALIATLVLITLVLFGILAVLIADAVWNETIHDTGFVRGKEYEPATTRVVASVDAKGSPTTRVQPVSEKFIVFLETEKSGHVTVEVKQHTYDDLTEGDYVSYTYRRGKIGGNVTGEKVTKN